ncbi:hypothetical protein H8S95_01800 [Pontibacter sp. KCTC 32443]|uniref:hypothetical protein n=1 Tax=Pontibacter TaxID=323449 RepID=UPI00164E2FF1|nr:MULTISPECIES: hypothetical protein [Pontibacter]MBC5772783.1 hypothetical protein [Pontibacter sp. KCTC 32443]
MELELKAHRELINEDEDDQETITVWRLINNKDAIEINLNRLLDVDISECDWWGEDQKLISVSYCDWDENHNMALVSNTGQILLRDIYSVEEDLLEQLDCFIVLVTGRQLLEYNSAEYYGIDPDDYRMGVMSKWGEYIISPDYDKIYFEEEDYLFYASRRGNEKKYTLDGNVISKSTIKRSLEEELKTLSEFTNSGIEVIYDFKLGSGEKADVAFLHGGKCIALGHFTEHHLKNKEKEYLCFFNYGAGHNFHNCGTITNYWFYYNGDAVVFNNFYSSHLKDCHEENFESFAKILIQRLKNEAEYLLDERLS